MISKPVTVNIVDGYDVIKLLSEMFNVVGENSLVVLARANQIDKKRYHLIETSNNHDFLTFLQNSTLLGSIFNYLSI